MGLTSALNTALNGLSLNETSIDVLGNNIANAGTNGFKASNVLFSTQLARTLSVGSRPTATSGGSNPQHPRGGMGEKSCLGRNFSDSPYLPLYSRIHPPARIMRFRLKVAIVPVVCR